MDEDKRKKILWIIAIVILLLAFLFWVLRTSDLGSNENNNNTNTEPPIFTAPSVDLKYKTPEVIKDNPTEFSVINLAKSYTARFGSWSTDNQGTNLNELLSLSTTKMQNYLKNIDLNFETEEFSGTTTKSLSAKILDIDEDRANVLVNTQKITTNGNLEEEVYYQEVEVKLVKLSDIWFVDQVIWK
jgi:hypothetical protein